MDLCGICEAMATLDPLCPSRNPIWYLVPHDYLKEQLLPSECESIGIIPNFVSWKITHLGRAIEF